MDTLLSAVCLSILFLAVPVSGETCQGPSSFHHFPRTDCGGAPVDIASHHGVTLQFCAAACCAEPTCLSFQHNTLNQCYLKNKICSAEEKNYASNGNMYDRLVVPDTNQQTTEVPTTSRYETSPTHTTVRTTQTTSTQVSSSPRQTQQSALPGTTVSRNTTTQTTQRPTLPGTTVSQYTTSQAAQRPTLPGTTVVSQQATNRTTGLAGGETAKSIGSWYNKPLNLALVCVGCAAGIIGVGGVLMYYYGNRRQRRRQVAQDPQDGGEE
ncbi:uncharacterized protein LOC144917913 [Branchiostoma floridae x Branchiostoma belcheri]